MKATNLVMNTVIVALILAGLCWVCSMFVHFGSVEHTDNAQVRQHIVPVSSRIQGFVREVRFDEFQLVHRGDLLVVLEDAEFRLQFAQAEANCQNALAAKAAMATTVKTTQNDIAVSEAEIEQARIRLANAQSEYERHKGLLAVASVAKQQFDAVETQFTALEVELEKLQRRRESLRLSNLTQKQRLAQHDAAIVLAQAALELARLNLSYTEIRAPCDGFTSRKTIHQGELVQPGRELVSVVDEQERWVVANYRERQLRNIRLGSKVAIAVDALPDVRFEGVVSGISDATGAQYALAPQDNSAGNFVKVEQRIPVRIAFAGDNDVKALARLSSGMNVECSVLFE